MYTTSRKAVSRFFTVFAVMLGVLSFASPSQATDDLIMQPETMVDTPELQPRILINVAARKLYLYEGDALIKSYPIAVGQNRYKTPLGTRSMTQIIWNPWWLPPASDWAANAKPTPPGPKNPLGPVKMVLGDAILVHGTNKEHTIGSAASHGCMRMLNNDAKELAHYLQSHYTSHTDPALFEKYQNNRGRSFYVKLDNPIPVEIVYEITQIESGRLSVYSDVYYKYPLSMKQKLVEERLSHAGVDLAKINRELLFQKIKEAKNKDLTLELQELTQNVSQDNSVVSQR